jgi:hypothetical protein
MCTALNTTRTQITVVNAHRFGTHRFMLDDKDLVFVMYKHTDTSECTVIELCVRA